MDIALIVLGSLLILMTIVPIVKATAWWIRIFDFPRLQIVAIGIVVLILLVAFYGIDSIGYGIFAISLVVSIGYQLYMIYPYTPLARTQVQYRQDSDPRTNLAILFANVLMDNRNSDDLLIQIRAADPDMVLLAETDDWWQQQVDVLEADYPYTVKYPQDNTYGILLYSRLELIDPEIKFLIQDDIPSIHGRVRLRSGDEVEFRCLHPRPPVPQEDPSSAPRDAEILIIGKESREDSMPFIVFGDLNDVAWSRTNYLFQNISGLLDPRVGRGFYHTFHAEIPVIRFPLDHLFHSNHFRLVDFQRLGYFGSDHFPVFITLSLERDAVETQPEPKPDVEDEKEAQEKIAFALEPPQVRNPDRDRPPATDLSLS